MQKTFHLSAPKMKKKKKHTHRERRGLNDLSRTAASSFSDTFDGSVVKLCNYMVILENTNIYLTHRHAAHTGVQHARPCIGTHFTDEREPLLPVDTVEMD